MDSPEQRPTPGSSGLDGPLEEVIKDIVHQLATKHDRNMVETVTLGIAHRFRGARITVFLPILIKKKASELLRSLFGSDTSGPR